MTTVANNVANNLLEQTRREVKQIGAAIEEKISQKKLSSQEKEELIKELQSLISLLEQVKK